MSIVAFFHLRRGQKNLILRRGSELWRWEWDMYREIWRKAEGFRPPPITLEEALRLAKLKGEQMTTDLALLTEKQMLERVNQAKFPQDLSQAEKNLLVQVALSYRLDPLLGELTIYQGRPFVSIDGRYRKAHETGQLDGMDTRPATKEERQAWEIPDGDLFFRAEVWKNGCARSFVGWGRVRKQETLPPRDPSKAGFRPLETNPQRMAEKRAEAQALRKAFFLPLPSFETAGTAEEEPPPTGGMVVEAKATITPPVTPSVTAAPLPVGATDAQQSTVKALAIQLGWDKDNYAQLKTQIKNQFQLPEGGKLNQEQAERLIAVMRGLDDKSAQSRQADERQDS